MLTLGTTITLTCELVYYCSSEGIETAGKEIVQKINDDLRDLGKKWNGAVASYAGFTEDAEKYAEYYDIELWEPDYLMREFFAVSISRAEEAKMVKL